MSAVASSSTAVISSSNSSSPVVCSNPSKRRNGTFRVLAEDYAQFTLADNDFHQILRNCELGSDPILDVPLTDHCNTAVDTTGDCLRERLNKDALGGSCISRNQGEFSRLTDEVEIDGDSASDELDLLPPLPSCSGARRKFPKWKIKLPNWLLCRNPRIPVKCIIM
ncbi:unnamed protein product [Litomosoides sigmodontis]|uniref:Uncharacterized protein n=1 Tax=Litomosoides sigmodontis TaxID=42156 RepID=A0A3P6U481_LITSI|nr:unnamed protein product [Litomosoides sigmodontis]